MTTSSITAQERAWHALRARRDQALGQPYSPLAQVALEWLDETARDYPAVPGRWSTDGDQISLEAVAADGLRRPGTDDLIIGSEEISVAEAGSLVIAEFGSGPEPVRIEVIKRTGAYALRIYDPAALARTGFTGVPAYPFDPDWVVQATFVPYGAPRTITVGGAQPGLQHHREAIGEARFSREGADHVLIIFGDHGDTIVFSDLTSGIETAPWRILPVSIPGDGTVTLDFNATVNLPFAFNDYGTCPQPPEGNHLDLAVTAGELSPDPTPELVELNESGRS